MSHETPTHSDDSDDKIDRLSDQVGSYDDARWRRGVPTSAGHQQEKSWEEIEADKQRSLEGNNLTPAQRRRIGRAATGPQYGEEALPVEDQSRSQEEYEDLHRQARPITDGLFEARIQRERKKAIDTGQNPDAIERAIRERRAKELNE